MEAGPDNLERVHGLRVALVSSEKAFRGGERQLSLLAEGLRTHGAEPIVACRGDSEVEERFRGAGHEVVPLPGVGPRALRVLRGRLRQWRPAVLHANDSRALTVASLAATDLDLGPRVAARRVAYPIRNPRLYRRLAHHVICVSSAAREACLEAGFSTDRIDVVADGVDPGRVRGGAPEAVRAEIGADGPVVLTVASLVAAKGHADLLQVEKCP